MIGVCGLLCAARVAWGQADTGRISGNVSDVTGALVPLAKVTATRTESNATSTVLTDRRGEYVFPNLQTGHYDITVQSQGFSTASKQGYELNDNSAITVDFTMQAGEQSIQVVVTATGGETVNTQTGEVTHVIDGETVRDLALNGRNYLDLLGTLPGSVVTDNGDAMANITSGKTTNIVMNGVRATANGLYLDGTVNKDIGGNDTQFNNVGIDFVDHASVQTSAFSSQWGSAAGPSINVVSRSGTNSFHGSVFEDIRNNKVDAVNFFSRNAVTYAPIEQHLRFNGFGAAVGGPIKKDKLFVFLGAEWKIIAQNSSPSTVTLPLQSQIAGNFLTSPGKCPLNSVATLSIQINTTTCDISNLITPFGHGIQKIYQNIISKATTYSGAACTTTGCSNNGNTVYELASPFRNHEYIARVDYNLSKRQNVFGRWIVDTHTKTNPLGDGTLPTTAYHDAGPANNVILSHTFIISPSTFNEFSFASLWSSINQTAQGTDWLKSTYGLSYTPIYPDAGPKLGIPLTSVYGYTTFDDDRFLNRSHTTYLQIQDIYTKVAGPHTIKVGAYIGRNRKDQNGKPYYNGNVSFTTSDSTNTTGNALADALLGNFANYSEVASDTYAFFRLWQAAAYIDDTWRILPKLSLNWGVRFEWMTPWTSQQDNLASFYPEYYDPTQAVTVNQDGTVVSGSGNRYNGMRRAGNGVPSSELSRVTNGQSADVLSVPTIGKRGFYSAQRVIAPRFGFAYDLYGDGTTALRGGFGLFYDTPQGNVAYSALNAPPYLESETIQNGNMDSLSSYAGQATTHTIGDMYSVSSHEQRAYVYQYNFGIQQQLDKGMFLQINYIGNQGRHLLHDPDINGVDPDLEDATFKVNSSVNVNYLRPYKGYGAIYQYRTDADSNYNGLQANLNRRVGKGRFTVAYTWSKSLSTSSGDTDVAHIFPYSKTYYYGYTTFDRRELISATYMVASPSFRGHNEILRGSLGNWMLTGTGRYQGGQRLTPTGTDTLGVGGRAQYNGYPVVYPHKWSAWWDPISPGDVVNFQPPAVGAIGNSPKGIIIGPSYIDLSISARKTFNYHTRYHLTADLSAFNVMNHPNFSIPGVNVNSVTTVKNSDTTVDHSSIGITSAKAPRQIQGGLRLVF